MALGFNSISSSPISSVPYAQSVLTGLVGTTILRSVTVGAGKDYTLTGLRGTTILRSVIAGAGNNITVTGVIGTATVADHQCVRTWNLVDTTLC